MMGVTLQAGPISLLAMSQLDWEKTLLKDKKRPKTSRRSLTVGVGPVRIHADVSGSTLQTGEAAADLLR